MQFSQQMTIGRRFVMLVLLCGLAIGVPAAMQTLTAWGELRSVQREAEGLAPPVRCWR